MSIYTGERCTFNSECYTGFCSSGICSRPKANDPCSSSTHCPAPSKCEYGFCTEVVRPSDCSSSEYFDFSKRQCITRKSDGERCRHNWECQEDSRCHFGKCASKCSNDDDCSYGEICYVGACKTGTRKDTTTSTTTPTNIAYTPVATTTTTYTPQTTTTSFNNSSLSGIALAAGKGMMISVAIGSLFTLILLIFAIWACYRCCCKSSKSEGQVLPPAQPIVVQQAPTVYPTMQSPYMASPSSSLPPQYDSLNLPLNQGNENKS